MTPLTSVSLGLLRAATRAADEGRVLARRAEPFVPAAVQHAIREPLFALTQQVLQATLPEQPTSPAQETLLPNEEQLIDAVIEQFRSFLHRTYAPGQALRAGNTKTYGLVRATLAVSGDLPAPFRHGLFAEPRTYRCWVRFGGPGPLAPPDIDDFGVLSLAVKVLGVPGPKLIDDEHHTQDLFGLTSRVFTTRDLATNLNLHRWNFDGAALGHFLHPRNPHLSELVLQAVEARVHSSPLETPYWSCVPYLLGEGRAMQYRFCPQAPCRTPVPLHPPPDYLRDAMRTTLDHHGVSFDLCVQRQTDPARMPIENASVVWPDALSPPVKVATLHIPEQRFDSPQQEAFAGNLSFNPWHAVPEHRPLGSLNRARRRLYLELSAERQAMNSEARIEPTGDEAFPGSPPLPTPAS